MSIPTIFTNANCQTATPGELNGGGMLRFCRTFKAGMPGMDVCSIESQEDYNMYQMGCVNGKHGTFIDNNNNTVILKLRPEYIPVLESPIEFPIGSHDNVHILDIPQYVEPYPIFVSHENCNVTFAPLSMCCPPRPAWSSAITIPPGDQCVIIDDGALEYFGKCCVSTLYSTYVNPLTGAKETPTGSNPATQLPTGSGGNGGETEVPESVLPDPDFTGMSFYTDKEISGFSGNEPEISEDTKTTVYGKGGENDVTFSENSKSSTSSASSIIKSPKLMIAAYCVLAFAVAQL
ncbi:hypothetical protein GGI07_001320 [Coemansia sp. Benny D115]|nr:hypothetical protein GGI07_001320 [Coemansia sp. Benny D115]